MLLVRYKIQNDFPSLKRANTHVIWKRVVLPYLARCGFNAVHQAMGIRFTAVPAMFRVDYTSNNCVEDVAATSGIACECLRSHFHRSLLFALRPQSGIA
jgi:hypothetical protein